MGNRMAPSGAFDAVRTAHISSNHSLRSPAGHYLDNALLGWIMPCCHDNHNTLIKLAKANQRS